MNLARVPEILRAAGLSVVEHSGWSARSNGSISDTVHWVWHHDASAAGDSPGVPAYMIRSYRRAGAQLWVDRYGRWHIIAIGRAYHAGRVRGSVGNANSVGIETDHTTGEAWPAGQLASLRIGTAALIEHYGGGAERLHFHSSICSPIGRKTDPSGLDLKHERVLLTERLHGGPVSPAEGRVLRQPMRGDVWVQALQARLQRMAYDITVDGDYGPATEEAVRHFQAGQGLEVDGEVGPKTWAALTSWAPQLTEAPQELGPILRAEGPSVMLPGSTMTCPGTADSEAYQLVLQGDGNLVLYAGTDRDPRRVVWALSWRENRRADRVVAQDDGNIVAYYGPLGVAVWHTFSWGHPGAYLAVQSDSNLVVYSPAGEPLWARTTTPEGTAA